jgi:UDP-N-acetylglucosamine--dolichyl-phosphate N-acetylglucosaminephosphotransferase
MPEPRLRSPRYPARAFPGDTFCYFSGMAFAVVAILGHFSKTLMLFFLPQIFNFILSAPQLFRLIPCPRHRVPKLREDGTLEASVALIEKPNTFTLTVVRLLSALKLAKVGVNGKKRSLTCTNLTILNFLLNFTGPIKEDTLTKLMVIVQLAGSVLAFGIRYGLAGFLYEGDRR